MNILKISRPFLLVIVCATQLTHTQPPNLTQLAQSARIQTFKSQLSEKARLFIEKLKKHVIPITVTGLGIATTIALYCLFKKPKPPYSLILQGPTGQVALKTAIDIGNKENIRRLLIVGAESKYKQLTWLPVIVNLLAEKKNVNAIGEGGMTPLHLAAFYEYPEVVIQLLGVGADPMLGVGADPKSQDKQSVTPLMMIAARGDRNKEIITALLQVKQGSYSLLRASEAAEENKQPWTVKAIEPILERLSKSQPAS